MEYTDKNPEYEYDQNGNFIWLYGMSKEEADNNGVTFDVDGTMCDYNKYDEHIQKMSKFKLGDTVYNYYKGIEEKIKCIYVDYYSEGICEDDSYNPDVEYIDISFVTDTGYMIYEIVDKDFKNWVRE